MPGTVGIREACLPGNDGEGLEVVGQSFVEPQRDSGIIVRQDVVGVLMVKVVAGRAGAAVEREVARFGIFDDQGIKLLMLLMFIQEVRLVEEEDVDGAYGFEAKPGEKPAEHAAERLELGCDLLGPARTEIAEEREVRARDLDPSFGIAARSRRKWSDRLQNQQQQQGQSPRSTL